MWNFSEHRLLYFASEAPQAPEATPHAPKSPEVKEAKTLGEAQQAGEKRQQTAERDSQNLKSTLTPPNGDVDMFQEDTEADAKLEQSLRLPSSTMEKSAEGSTKSSLQLQAKANRDLLASSIGNLQSMRKNPAVQRMIVERERVSHALENFYNKAQEAMSANDQTALEAQLARAKSLIEATARSENVSSTVDSRDPEENRIEKSAAETLSATVSEKGSFTQQDFDEMEKDIRAMPNSGEKVVAMLLLQITKNMAKHFGLLDETSSSPSGTPESELKKQEQAKLTEELKNTQSAHLAEKRNVLLKNTENELGLAESELQTSTATLETAQQEFDAAKAKGIPEDQLKPLQEKLTKANDAHAVLQQKVEALKVRQTLLKESIQKGEDLASSLQKMTSDLESALKSLPKEDRAVAGLYSLELRVENGEEGIVLVLQDDSKPSVLKDILEKKETRLDKQTLQTLIKKIADYIAKQKK